MTPAFLIQADARRIPLADGSVHSAITSGPYWGAEGLLAIDRPSPTLSGQSREPIQNFKGKGFVRRLTPLECLRLQSGPDDFKWPEKISKTNQYRVVGNGWSSLMGYVLSCAFASVDPDSRTVVSLFCGGGLGDVGWHGRYWSYETAHVARGIA